MELMRLLWALLISLQITYCIKCKNAYDRSISNYYKHDEDMDYRTFERTIFKCKPDFMKKVTESISRVKYATVRMLTSIIDDLEFIKYGKHWETTDYPGIIRIDKANGDDKRPHLWIIGENHDLMQTELKNTSESPYFMLEREKPLIFIEHQDIYHHGVVVDDGVLYMLAKRLHIFQKEFNASNGISKDIWNCIVLATMHASGSDCFTADKHEHHVRKQILRSFIVFTKLLMLRCQTNSKSIVEGKFLNKCTASHGLVMFYAQILEIALAELRSFSFYRNMMKTLEDVNHRHRPIVMILGAGHSSLVAKLLEQNQRFHVRYFPYFWFSNNLKDFINSSRISMISNNNKILENRRAIIQEIRRYKSQICQSFLCTVSDDDDDQG